LNTARMYPETEYSIEALAGDASDRSYFRLIARLPNIDPPSVVLMKKRAPFRDEEDDFLKIRDFLESCGVPVPSVYGIEPQKGYIYLEDCGDLRMEDAILNGGEEEIVRRYRESVNMLVQMQVDGTSRLKAGNPASARKFDVKKYMEELGHTEKWFIEELNGKRLSPEERSRIKKLFMKIVEPIEKEPPVFAHRDYHARNIMINGNRYYILDFQDARLGPPQYDLASLLYDSYVKLSDDIRASILDYYLKLYASRSEKKFNEKDFTAMLYRVAVQRNLKALGTFGFQTVSRKNNLYRKYIPNTVDYLKTNIYKLDDFEEKDAEWLLSLLTASRLDENTQT